MGEDRGSTRPRIGCCSKPVRSRKIRLPALATATDSRGAALAGAWNDSNSRQIWIESGGSTSVIIWR